MAAFYIDDHFEVDPELIRKFVPATLVPTLQLFVNDLQALAIINHNTVAEVFKKILGTSNLKMKDFGHPMRIILTGSEFSPRDL